ncbi:cytochrome P450 [Aspergillus melleus]|uniref:cytochrome P450 n=1 Tax=Aspergillus melleus TaxID=138277 RepID=UPI001E8E0300|nr:uncharacterized protein LDX57_001987 [Aspergillus melleus]KAH8424229.1 hypothetical protein LDX57_001987 [Aspergillus melleus]
MFSILTVFLSAVVISTTSSIVYNLYLSPLSRFPGPAICAVSRIPYLWHNWKGKLVHWVHDLHLTYGDVVRIAPDELTFINIEAHKDIYGLGSRNLRDRRFYGETPKGVQDILRSDDRNHARFRRVLNHSLSERAIQEKQSMIRWHDDKLVEKIRSSFSFSSSSSSAATPTHDFDVTRLYDLTTFDIMAELCFGEPLYVHKSDEFHGWMDSMFTMIHHAAVFRTAQYFRWTLIFVPVVMFVLGPLMKKQESYFKKCQERVDRRMESKLPRKDMWSHIIDLPKELQLTRSEMHFNSQILMIGGTETTATLLAGMTCYFLRSPQIMEKLCAEIRDAFQSESDITAPWLSWNILTLAFKRVFASFLRLLWEWRVSLPLKEILSAGIRSLGMYTGISIYGGAIAWSPKHFKNPKQYVPERWLNDPEYAQDNRAALQPFSYGPRSCVGQTFAYHEARIILATLLWHFDMSLCEESIGWPDDLTVYMGWVKKPLMVRMQSRQGDGVMVS